MQNSPTAPPSAKGALTSRLFFFGVYVCVLLRQPQVQLELPHLNVLTKCDLVDEEELDRVRFFWLNGFTPERGSFFLSFFFMSFFFFSNGFTLTLS